MILQTHLYADSADCEHKDWTGGCAEYKATYNYVDGAECRGGQ